ncbi:hypothetical protein ACFX1Z_018910 [Malus domestica]
MNPAKCTFGVSADNFLGFLVHHRDIEVDENKARAIIDAPHPTTKKQLNSDKFKWSEEHRATFTQIKVAFATPPVLVPPRCDKPLKLYISTVEESIGCLLAQDTDAGLEQAIFYLSRHLNPLKINYSPFEKLCLALFLAALKLRHYMLPSVT